MFDLMSIDAKISEITSKFNSAIAGLHAQISLYHDNTKQQLDDLNRAVDNAHKKLDSIKASYVVPEAPLDPVDNQADVTFHGDVIGTSNQLGSGEFPESVIHHTPEKFDANTGNPESMSIFKTRSVANTELILPKDADYGHPATHSTPNTEFKTHG